MGYEWEELVGRTSVGLGILEKKDRKAIVEKLSENGIISHYEYNLRTKSGDILRCFLFVELINIAGEDRLVSSILDITDQKKAEEERKKLEEQVRHSQKLESLGVLAGGIAHDFNNLLMGIMGNVGMAQMKLSPESPGHTHLSGIQVAAERAADLTNQMLAYSGKGKFDVKSVNLSSAIEEMSHLLRVSVSKNVVIKYDLDKDLPTVEADPSQLHQILMNLLTNSSDSYDGKSGDVVVSTKVKKCDKAYLSVFQFGDELPEGKYVYLEVSDTGSGMDEEVIERIFDPFFSTKEGGRGLGLSAVIGIVRGHNGAIKVISEPDRGTTFKLLFPASEKTAEEVVEESLTHIGYRGDGTILVVDDEEGVRDIATSILEEFGFEVLLARDGEEALELFKERADKISLVLLDLSMPGMGGIETFRHLKQHWADVKVILSSGYTEEDAISSFTGQGLADFIQKPYRPEELISKVRKVLEQES
jgi:signal transduction histidine kinase/CheY-like chemotaxis protein